MPDGATQTSQGGEPAQQTVTVQRPQPVQVQVTRQETNAFVARLVSEHGSMEGALLKIAGEQLRYRKRAQAAEKRATEAEAKVPPQGSVVLTGEDAKAYNEIKTANVALAKVPEQLRTLSDLQSRQAATERDAALTTAAGKKWKKGLLTTLVGDRPLEFKDVHVRDGDEVVTQKEAYIVVGTGDKAVREPLETWLGREHKDLVDLLKAEPENGTPGKTTPTKAPASGGTMPRTPSAASAPKGKDAAMTARVDTQLNSQFLTPSQRRKGSGETATS